MFQLALTNYLSGVMDLACAISRKISLSSIRVTCFKKKGFKNNFSQFYKINPNKIKLKEVKKDLFYKLVSWLGREKIVLCLVEIVQHEVGEIVKVYDSNDELCEVLSGYEGGLSGFYFVEDVFFVETEQYMVCFIIGNNE